jgi:FlgN protein
MTATTLPAFHADPLLPADLLAHLDAQIASVARLLEIALAQGAAIRAQDVDAVVRHVAAFQAELERRTRVEDDRARLLARAGTTLGVAPGTVTLTQLTGTMAPDDGALVHARSGELQRLLAELMREHRDNQALMRQELAFLDHLLGQLDPSAPAPVYEAGGTRRRPPAADSARRQLDLHA